MRATVAAGFGSVAVLWALSLCTELSTTIISPRLMIVELRHTTGQTVRLVGGHMHDDPGLRKDQWRDLSKRLRSLSSMATIFLMDHNSLVLPGQDSLKGHQGDRSVREARYQEMEVLAKFDMHDVWGLAHDGSEHPPPAATYGWAYEGRRANPRRLDRIHVNAALTEWVSGAYTVLTGANHKGVVLQLSPPAIIQGKPRPRFPEGMLGDEQAMPELREQVASISIEDPEGWWAEALSVVSAAGRQWARMNSSRGFSQVEALVRNSSPTRVIPAGREYLEELGKRPTTHQEAYQCLAFVVADEQREGRMQQFVTKLRRKIAKSSSGRIPQPRKKECNVS